jgi:hypothetical protein
VLLLSTYMKARREKNAEIIESSEKMGEGKIRAF